MSAPAAITFRSSRPHPGRPRDASSPDRPRSERRQPARRPRRPRWPRLSRLLARLIAAWLVGSGTWVTLARAQPPAPTALPSGGNVVVGSGQIATSGANMVVQQSTARLGIDWQSFNIGAAASVQFVQPSADSIALNRVVGNDASQIYGRLTANGQVFLTNPNGVLFARGAKVDVGGLVASTLDLTQQDFAAGRYSFAGGGDGAVLNQGALQAGPGGYIALFSATQVDNSGAIHVPAGQVVLASGRAATVAISGSGLLSAVVDPGSAAGSVLNSGSITADGGTVRMTAQSAQALAGSLVNNSGLVRASSMVERNGEIWIVGDNVAHSGRLDASAPAGGDGGRIMVLADMAHGRADVGGVIDAGAAAGRGGFVETSAATVVVAPSAQVSTAAPGGQSGTWLIDPNDFTVAASGGNITGAALSSALAGGNVSILTTQQGTAGGNGDIFVNDTVGWAANRLTLSAERHIALNSALGASGSASLALEYGQGAVAAGNTATYTVAAPVTLPAGASFSTKLGSNGTTTNYTVVTTLAALQAIDDRTGGNTAITNRLTTNYALGADIDASSTSGTPFDPIGDQATSGAGATNSFSGRFDGLGHTITGLVVNPTSSTSAGLFANTNNATIRDLTLAGGSVTGGTYVGAVAGIANGTTTFQNVRSSAAVTGSGTSSVVGGIVGQDTGGAITGAVVGSAGNPVAIVGNSYAGGVVGYHNGSGAIGNSSATVAITGDAEYAGGLVGRSTGAINNGAAAGTVQTSGSAWAGGLVGNITAAVSGSTANVAVTVTNNSSYAGGLIGTTNNGVSGSTAQGAVSGGTRAGGLVADFSGTSSIQNSSASGEVSSSATTASLGGLVGYATGSAGITNSSASGQVTSTAATGTVNVGGAVGYLALTGAITGLSATGNVTGGNFTGGVIGEVAAASAVFASGSISNGAQTVAGRGWVGGMIGYSGSTGAISGLTSNAASVTGTSATSIAGGLAGRTGGAVSNSSASATVQAGDDAGGLIGNAAGTGSLTNLSASGPVTSTATSALTGGLIGSNTASGNLSGSSASGAVQSAGIAGGLVGSHSGSGSILNSFTAVSSTVQAGGDAGGLVGQASGSGGAAISDSIARGTVASSATGAYVGGLVGDFSMAGGMARVQAQGASVSGGARTGGLVGSYASAGTLVDATTTATTVSSTSANTSTYVGGLIGYHNGGAVSGATSGAAVSALNTSGGSNAGGLIGRSGGAVSTSSATGNVSSATTAGAAVGGLIGSAEGTGAVTDGTASGSVTSASTTTSYVGGLIGYTSAGSVVRGTATGSVSGGLYTGGLIGQFVNNGNIQNADARGDVSGRGDVGGIVGYASGSGAMTSSTAQGGVTSSATSTYSVGGAAGYFGLAGGMSGINSTGNVAGGAQTGGVVGYFNASATLSSVSTSASTVSGGAWVGGIVGYSNAASITGLTATAAVTATGTAGGLAGRTVGSITSSSASGAVNAGNDAGGLVGRAEGTASLTDVTATGRVASTATSAEVGGLAGYVNGNVTRGHATGVVSGGNVTGGLVGTAGTGTITDSTATGATVTGRSYVGGLVGQSGAAIVGSSSSANVQGDYAGGLVGYLYASGTSSGNSATGSVLGGNYAGGLIGYGSSNTGSGSIASSTASGAVRSESYAGGLAGWLDGYALSGSHATGHVTVIADSAYAGGLVGRFGYYYNQTLSNSTASGNVTTDSVYGNVGGLVGVMYGSITGSSASGTVQRLDSTNSGAYYYENYTGGLVGYFHGATIADSHATGPVTGRYHTGGLVGLYSGSGSITGSTASGAVNGGVYVGGLVGQFSSSGGTIANSAATGAVSTNDANGGYVGGLVGYVSSASANLSNVSASGNVAGGSNTYAVGGLIGQLDRVGIETGFASGHVTGAASSAGGLVGYANPSAANAWIRDSRATGDVSTTRSSGYAGGLVGQYYNNGGYGGILSSSAEGDVAATGSNAHAGGLVGYYYSGTARGNADIRESFASGDVLGTRYAGGLVAEGYLANGIVLSGATGDVTLGSLNSSFAGGLVGYFYAYSNASAVSGNTPCGGSGAAARGCVDQSYAGGAVTLAAGAAAAGGTSFAGGLIGQIQAPSTATLAVSDAYATGNVQIAGTGNPSATLRVGGLVGEAQAGVRRSYATGAVGASGASTITRGGLIGRRSNAAIAVTQSFWATDASGQAASDGGTAKTLAELRQLATYPTGTGNWSIADTAGAGTTWRIYEGLTTPLLAGLLTPASITLADTSKVYDGTTSFGNGSLSGPSGALARPDLVFVNAPSADVGSYQVGAGGVYSSQRGYDLSVSGNAQLSVTPRPLTLTGVIADKVYDGTRTATVSGTGQPAGLVAGEDLTINLAGVSAVFDTKNVGTNKSVTLTGYTLADGARGKAANYSLANSTTTTASVTKAPLTGVNFTATDRAYDGSVTVAVTATGGTLAGVFGSDSVAVDVTGIASGTMADKNVGVDKPVTVSGAALTGADAGNYQLVGADGVTVDITPRTLTVNGLTADNRQYNRNTTVTVRLGSGVLSGAVAGDSVELVDSSVNGSIADKNVGTGKAVTVPSLRLRGTDSANYTTQAGSVTVDITPYQTNFYIYNITGTNRVYDGTANATVGSDFSHHGGDDIQLVLPQATYADKNVAYNGSGQVTSKTITVTGATLTGADAANYTLTNTSYTTSGTISPKPLAVTGVVAVDRVYDGTRDVSLNLANANVDLSAKITGDDLGVQIPGSGTVTGQMANKNVGNNKAVTSIPGLTLTGADQLNYTIAGTNGVLVNITPKPLTASYTGVDRAYDGSTGVRVVASSTDVVAGDSLSYSVNDYYYFYSNCQVYCGTFTGTGAKNVGTAKPVVVNGVYLTGNDANNYALTNPDGGTTTASVTPRTITAAFNGVAKVYDGSATASVTLNRNGTGIIGSDAVTSTQDAVFTGTGAKNVGTGKAIAVSNIALGGADAGNYALAATTGSATANITAKAVTLSGITAANRAYDGTTTVAVSGTHVGSSGFVAGDDVAVQLPAGGLTTGTMANKNVGTAKPVTVTGLALGGADAANYLIDAAGSGITVDITAKALTAAYTGVNRAYNGGTVAQVVASSADIVTGDTVNFAQTAAFTGIGARDAGTNKTITVTNIAISGADAANYALQNTTATARADVTAKPVTVNYAGVARDYNGVADRSAIVTGSSTDIVAGDLVGFTQQAQFRGDGSAGTGKTVDVTGITLSGAGAGNYALAANTATTTATINPKPIGVTGITATDRVYDGTRTVAINVNNAAIDAAAVIAGDDVRVTLPPGGITTGTMATKDAGAAKPVDVTGLAIDGTSAANYRLVGAAGLTVNVTPRGVTAAYTGIDKVYDGSIVAPVAAASGDFLAVDLGAVGISAQGSFADGKNVGSGKTVNVSGAFVTGVERNNYTLLNPSGQTTASVTPKTLTPAYAGGSKVYDGGTAANVTAQRNGVVSGDAVDFTQTAEFTGSGAKNVGSGKPIAVSAIALGGADAGNYVLSSTTAAATGAITPKPITIAGLTNVSATDRVYDGTRTVQVIIPGGSTLTPNSGDIVSGDDVTIAVPSAGATTGTMADKNVGTNKAVVISGLTLSGTDAGNYVVAGTAGVTVSISPLAVTAAYVGVSKVYDGSVNATVSGSAAGFVAGDAIGISGAGQYTGTGAKNVGTAKAIQVTSAQLTGADAVNYLLTNPTGTAVGNVTPRPVTPSYSGTTRIYDGTTVAPVTASGTGFVLGDDILLSQTAVFTGGSSARNVGTNKPIAVSGIALSGADAGNYQLTIASTTTTGTITPRPITLENFTGASAVDRVYDGSNLVVVNVGSIGAITPRAGDVIAGDDVTVHVPTAGTTTGTMTDKSVGQDKAVTITGMGLSGADAANYTLAAAGGVTVDITPRQIAATYSGGSRVYDGTVIASVTGSSADLIAGDVVAIAGTGVFTGTGAKNVGTGKAIDVQSASLGGADAGNYLLTNPTGSALGDVTPRNVTVSYFGGTRVYDGTVAAPVSASAAGFVTGDAVLVTQSAVFTGAGAKNVGDDKAVAISGIALAGADAGNYALTATGASTTASITPRPVAVTGLTGIAATDRVYDGTRTVQLTISGTGQPGLNSGDLVAGDDVTIGSLSLGTSTGTMADKHVGTAKDVAVDGLALAGADAANYRIASTVGVSVNITPRTLAPSWSGASKIYDGTDTITLAGQSADIVAGDLVSITGNGVFTGGKNVGTGKTIAVSGGTLLGADARDYLLASTTATATGDITPRALTIQYTGSTRVYDGTAAAPVSATLAGLIGGDDVQVAQSALFSGAGARNVGANKAVTISGVTLGGSDAGNYSATVGSSPVTASITPRPLTISGLGGIVATDRVYDGTRLVDVTVGSVGSLTGDVIQGDDVTIAVSGAGVGGGTLVDKNAGTNKPVTVNGLTLGGADAANYMVGPALGVTVNITPKAVTVAGLAAVDRVYDGSTSVGITTTGGTLAGAIAGDDVRLATSGVTGQMADKNVGSAKPVTLGGQVALAGGDAANYSVGTGPLTVNITPRDLAVAASVPDRVYDGTTNALLAFTDDRVAGDQLTLGASASFADKNVGSGKAVSVSTLTLAGADAANYRLPAGTPALTGNILRAPLTLRASDQTKIYGDTFVFTGAEFVASGLVAGESIGQVSLSSPGAAAAAGVSGSPYAITAAAPGGGTADLANYTLTLTDGALVVQPRPLIVIANSYVTYPGAAPTFSASVGDPTDHSGLANGDQVAGFTVLAPAEAANAAGGSVFELTPSGGVWQPGSAANYAVRYENGLLVILPKPPTPEQQAAGGGGGGLAVTATVEEVAAAARELDRTSGVLGQPDEQARRGDIATRRLGSLLELSAGEIELIASRIAAEAASSGRRIDAATLQRMPLISFDANLRRLILGTETAATERR